MIFIPYLTSRSCYQCHKILQAPFVVGSPSETGTGLTLTGGARRREKPVAVEQRCRQRSVMVEQEWGELYENECAKKPNLLNETAGGLIGVREKDRKERMSRYHQHK